MRCLGSSLLLLPLCTALQIPFTRQSQKPDDAPSSPPFSFTLQQSVHLPYDAQLPPLRRTYSTAEHDLLAASTGYSTTQSLNPRLTTAWRPSSPAAFQATRRHTYSLKRRLTTGLMPTVAEWEDEQLARTFEWQEEDILMPNTSDVATISAMAKMASNAYAEEGSGSWWDLEWKWNVTESFGWKEDGIRGHVFATPDNSTIVVAIKGTSATFLGGGGTTGRNDKINDNLLFSCCCARVDWSWSTVCDCYAGPYTCRQDCVEHAVMTKSAYYPAATNLFNNITALYPHSQIWLTGHSLGGSLASMLSRTYGVPSVAFEAPGDLLPSRRLHLPLPPPASNFSRGRSLGPEITTHIFHTADPIAMGVCNGALSTCAVGGFALETKCHTGESIIYDTVGRLGWSVDIRTHSIKGIIERVLLEEWGVGDPPPSGPPFRRHTLDANRKQRRKRWGWWPLPGGGKGGDDDGEDGGGKEPKHPKPEPDDGQHGGRGVPDAIRQDGQGPDGEECVECTRWEYD